MNIDYLRRDIFNMEKEEPDILTGGTSKNTTEYLDLCDISYYYDEAKDKCIELIEKFEKYYGYKINII